MSTSVIMDACRKYGITRYHQVSTDEVMAIFLLTDLTCSLPRRLLYILQARILPQKRQQIFLCWLTTALMVCL